MTDITLAQVGADLARLHQYNVALEGFQRVMQGREVVTGPTAMAMRIALEDAEVDQSESKGVTGKDLVTGIKKVGITLKNIIQWLLRTIGKLIEKIGQGMQRLGEVGRKNDKRIKALSSDQTALLKGEADPDTFKFNPNQLCIAGEFVGHEMEHAQIASKFVRWLITDYINGFIRVLEGTEKLVAQHMTDESPEAFLKALGALIGSSIHFPGVKGATEDYAPEYATDKEHTLRTVPMLGDFGLVMFDPAAAATVFPQGVEKIQQYLKIDVVEYNTKKEFTGERLPFPGADQLKQINSLVTETAEYWNSNDKTQSQKLEKAVTNMESIAGKLTQSESTATNTIGNVVGMVIQRLGTVLTSGNKWASRALSTELHYLTETIDFATGRKKGEE
ncbi:hypothetical protein [Pseudomonas phage D6]|nr:hypothetical protein [Pseudomonas phage D6]